ncbi:MAG: sulfotransferase [Hyphomonadaceae bacterium]
MQNDDPRPLLQEAAALRQTGRFAEAERAYEKLLARWPELADSWYNLGWLQRRAGRYDRALDSYAQALARGAAEPEEIHLNRAVIFADHLRREAEAEAELNAALARNAAYTPALLNLGNLKEDQGKRTAAQALYERVLTLDPDHAEALARLGNLARVSGPDDPLIAQLEQALDRPGLSANARANLGFALGRVRDAAGLYGPAFDAYAAANRASAEDAPQPAYDRRAQEQLVDDIIAAFPAAGADEEATAANPPIFICGMFRSGSTLTEQVLASHASVSAGGELDLLPAMVRNELSPFPAAMARVDEQALAQLARRYLKTVRALFPNAPIVTDKRPDNFLYVGLIKRLFPRAKIVHTRRDPLDNCLSVYFLHLDRGMGYALDLMNCAHFYRQHARLMDHWRALYGADLLDFDYDAFVRAPRPTVEHLLRFCGLDWDENCLSFHTLDNSVKTASVWQVREPLYDRSSGRWRNYEPHLGELRAYLGDLISNDV